MNLVMIAKLIQEGYRKYYYMRKTEGLYVDRDYFIVMHVMKNIYDVRDIPDKDIIRYLIGLETSVLGEM